MKMISWNVNGVRAIMKKDFPKSVNDLDADVLCIQETKANAEQVKIALELVDGYHIYANGSKARKGYSGTAILSRTEPMGVSYDMGVGEHDQEGRIIAAEYEGYYIVTVYVPNSGNELVRLDYRTLWDKDFLNYLKDLEKNKPVIVCGDFNVAHEPIDIARPKANYNKTAGYTQKEIDGFDGFMNHGFVDTFRYKFPEEVKYTWWSFRAGARAKNVGWRIDYFLVSRSFLPNVKHAFILNEFYGSDHCPLGIEI
ncbi:MAG: exodeoxyribonuclease III [Cytophagales bacterium]|nr:exodeoxyribonuclease III [Cytophagales bacterium]